MKMINTISRACTVFILAVAVNSSAQAQAFRKGSLLVSISEGNTWSDFSTSDINQPHPVPENPIHLHGCRDPLIVEYGLSNRWGISVTMGNDIFNVNPSKHYAFDVTGNSVKIKTSEFTFDCNYHFFVTKRLDVSAFASTGTASVAFKGGSGDAAYQYTANGLLVRTGLRARYYFFKRFGVFAMVSAYASSCSPKDVKGNTVGNHFATNISGIANEFGFCYRILR